MAGIVNGVSAGVAFFNRGFVNLTGRYIPSVAGVKRNVLQVMNTCSRICSFMRNSGFGICCAMGVAGLITTSLCTGRGLSRIFVNPPSNHDYSIYNRFSCINPYNASCSGCHSMQLLFGIGNIIIFNSVVLKKIYQYCKRYILRAGVVPPIEEEEQALLLASGVGIIVLGMSLLDALGSGGTRVYCLIYASTTLYFMLGLLRLQQHHEA